MPEANQNPGTTQGTPALEKEKKKPVRFILDGGMSVSAFFPERPDAAPYFIVERRYLKRHRGREEWMTAKTWRPRDLVTLQIATPAVLNFRNHQPGEKVDMRTERNSGENGSANGKPPEDGENA